MREVQSSAKGSATAHRSGIPTKLKFVAALCIALIVIGCALSVAIYLRAPSEPSYNGKRLSEWLGSGPFKPSTGELPPEAAAAVRAMGIETVAPMLEMLKYRDSRAKRALLRFLSRINIKPRVQHQFDVWNGALRGFRALGSNAEPAMFMIEEMLSQPGLEAGAGVLALEAIGPAAVPALIRGLKRPAKDTRLGCANVLGILGTNAASAVPILLHLALKDEKDVRSIAVEALAFIESNVEMTMTAFIQCLNDDEESVRRAAAWGLWRFGSRGFSSQEAVAALAKVLTDPSARVREVATNALLIMDPQRATLSK